MKTFSQLFEKLDQTTKTNERIKALVEYLELADEESKLWAIALLVGKRPKRAIQSRFIKAWIMEMSGISEWLFEESYQVVGDMSETISLLLPDRQSTTDKSLQEWMQEIVELTDKDDAIKKTFVQHAWNTLNRRERFVFNKLIGGSFRVGVSQKNMVRALSMHSGKEENELAHRLMGKWSPETHTYKALILQDTGNEDASRPYPFFLAYALDGKANFDANPEEWLAERKWDGIRGQLIKRKEELFIWTRGEELVTDKYPELHALAKVLPDGVAIDGELLPFKDGRPLAFSEMQRRIGRKTVGKKLLQEVPVTLLAYDLMEYDGIDIRSKTQTERRHLLEILVAEADSPQLLLSDLVHFKNLNDLTEEKERSRSLGCEGLMLKRKSSSYQVGRKRGDWWKWKVDPLVIDAVMIYAMRGHGRRASLYTDYTFAVWDGTDLVPFTKAYSGLTDEEFKQVDRFVKANIVEKFGPVRSVTPELVFEIAFEGIAKSTRHKSGIALRFPRMNRWRKDKKPEEANTLQDLYVMLENFG